MIDPSTIQALYPFTLDQIVNAVLADRFAQCAGSVGKTAASLGLSVPTVRGRLRALELIPDATPRGPYRIPRNCRRTSAA